MKNSRNTQLPLWSVAPTGRGQFLNALAKMKAAHGGGLGTGKRKTKRPLSFKRPMHLVLRSEKALGKLSLLRHSSTIASILKKQANRHQVRILHYVNVGNHLHLKVRAYSRESFGAFLKSFSALVARRVTGAKRGAPVPNGAPGTKQSRSNSWVGPTIRKFWDALAFTRILSTQFEEKILRRYFTANLIEVEHGSQVREIFLGKDPLSRTLGYG